MSSEEAKPVLETPAVETTPAVTETPAVEAPKVEEAKPEETPAAATEAEAPVEEAKEEAKPVEPKESGHLHYHAPGNFLKEILPIPPKKVFFWFSDEPVEPALLKAYLLKGKEAATSTAAWASQTGKGLLFFNKHGEDKAAPSGALNLADAEEIKPAGTSEFTFKLHGHKHKFDAQTGPERESWVASIKKIAEEAKAKKDELLSSEGYKEALAKLKPAPVAALAAPKIGEDVPKKSTEETPAEDEAKKASKSRSRSRGPFGFLKTKKEEVKDKVEGEEVKEETPAAEPVATEATPAEAAPVEDAAAPVTTDAVPAVEEKKEEPVEEPKKENRRMSRFESFFKGKPKEAKKEEAPVAPEETAAEPVAEETPAVVEPAAEEAPAAAATEEAPKEETEEEEKKEDAAPAKEIRKSSFLTGLKGFTQKVRSPSSEHPPAEPAKVEETAAEAAAETSEAPVAEPAVEEPVAAGETSKTEKRRSSFFNFPTINKKKAEATPAAEEATKPEEATEEAAKPEEEAVAPEAAEEKPEASPKEAKPSPFASIGRRVSKVIRGDKAKKEAKAAPAVEEAKEEAKEAEEAAETPAAALPEPIKVEEPAAPTAIGDVVPEAVTVGTAPQSTPTVSATA